MRYITIIGLAAGLMILGCGTNDPDSGNTNPANNTNPASNKPNPSNNTSPDPEPDVLKQTFAVSECGGFRSAEVTDEPTFGQTPSYCDAEVLDWSYDDAAGELKLSNKRVLLNCCGSHDIKVTKQSDGSYLVSETDAPDENGGRCHCMCVFDFDVTVKIPKGKIDIKLVREVTDGKDGEQEIFSGQLDLATGSGIETVDTTDVGPWCENDVEPDPEQQVSHSPEVSECGGFVGKSNGNALSYCDAEVLEWSYDAKAQQLKLADNRVELNCCGVHDISVTKSNDGAYTVTETDKPVDGARCNCNCVFDFVTVIDGVTGDSAAIKLMRTVSESSTAIATILFDGTLDLTAGSGVEILDTTPTGFCN